MKPTLGDLESLARGAGQILRASYGKKLHVDYKDVINPVTEVDHRSEAFLLAGIRSKFPGHAIVAEESGTLTGEAQSDGQSWYIDPLDGTVNYAHGVPVFAVSVAYAENGAVQLGVVYDPMMDECFSAARGRGAWCNGQALRASATPDLDHSLLVTGFPYDIRSTAKNNLENYARLALLTQGVRRIGSAAIDLCYVAAGRFDGYWELQLSPWDVAAGGLIAQEAGAIVTRCDGGDDYLGPPASILAANRQIYPEMLQNIHL
ncbi:MAG: inositol monophosphatase family protein [Chloroflexota bacterium]